MSRYVSNRNSDGKTDENGHFRLPLKLVDGEILEGFELKAQSNPDMTITITKGEAKIPYSDYAYAVWSDADEKVTIATASTTGNRIDRVVAYVDRGMSFTAEQVNHPDALKFKIVQGTPASTAVAPTDTQIQSAIGAGNPYINLGTVTVPMNTTTVTSQSISMDNRKGLSLASSVKMPEMTALDGTRLKFAVIQDGEALPEAIENATLVVLVVKK